MDLKTFPEVGSEEEFFKIKINNQFDAYFSAETGFLQKFVSSTTEIRSKIKLIKYGTTNANEKSGAYLFLPDGPAVDIDPNLLLWIRVEHGNPLRDRVCANYTIVLHCVEIYRTRLNTNILKMPLFSVWNVVDLRNSYNYELAMHIETDIENSNVLYTDLNGFQYVRRRGYLSKLHIQGNVYPMSTGAFIQDDRKRMSILTSQPAGVASLEPSSIQVFLDRRLDQDDNRGMEQPMNDNVVVSSRFLILFESIVKHNTDPSVNELPKMGFPSVVNQILLNNMLHQLIKLRVMNSKPTQELNKHFIDPHLKPPCDIHLVNLRTMQNRFEEPLKDEVALIFHRFTDLNCPSNTYIHVENYLNEFCFKRSFQFQDFFNSFLSRRFLNRMISLPSTLTFSPEYSSTTQFLNTKYLETLIQPMQIEGIRVLF